MQKHGDAERKGEKIPKGC